MRQPFPPRSTEQWSFWLDRIFGTVTAVELALAVLMVVLALAAPRTGQAVFGKIERGAAGLLHSPGRQLVTIALLALLARAAFLPWLGAPAPLSHDEHSLILQAQTFLQGRLANPTPPYWEHLEAIHINVFPAYASMYFPGRGLPLAVGLLLADQAWVGVWLSFILMCVAAVWMLQGWVRLPWALLGGVLLVLRLGVFSYWINSYWGGALTALGGMLVVGAIPRLLRRPDWTNGAVMGLGALLLLITRPMEGALLCLPIGIGLLVKLIRTRNGTALSDLVRIGMPVAALVTFGAVLLLANNQATTGDALVTPYELNRQQYAITPAFLVAPAIVGEQRGPEYFREFYRWENINYARRVAPSQMIRGAAAKVYYSWNFYIGFILTPAFLAGLWASRRDYLLLSTFGFFYTGYFFETWNFPHYTAPILSVILVLTMRGFEWLRLWSPGGLASGLFLTRAMPAAVLLAMLVPAASVVAGWPRINSNHFSLPCCALTTLTVRTEVMAQLDATPGRDLVLVATENHPVHSPIAYNEPDPSRADIVWAHRVDPKKDAALLAHLPGRVVWDLEWEDGYRLTRRSPELMASQ